MTQSIKQRLAEGQPVRVFSLGALAGPKWIELVAMMGGYHGVWIDQEHSAVPHQQLEIMMLACRASGLDAFARVAPTDYTAVMRPLEAGAGGVMVAQIRTVDEVEQVVQWASYPPRGVRGLFSANFEARYGLANPREQIELANRDRWLAIQIETPEAVACVDRIAAIAGVDSLFVGPGDLACTLGVPGQEMHPKCIDALKAVAAAANAAGKSWGILARGAEHAAKCRELGCRLLSLGGDMDAARRGVSAVQEIYRDFF
jgi:2-dehydro-3-deoxyglucarate aldolase/4-hydroxy-2-oxoheptanedioate aldolase